MDLTDAQWAFLEPLFRPTRREDGRGRPWQDTRAVLNGVFWILRTGAPWHDLPARYPPYQTCHRRPLIQRSASYGLVARSIAAVLARAELGSREAWSSTRGFIRRKRGSRVGRQNAAVCELP